MMFRQNVVMSKLNLAITEIHYVFPPFKEYNVNKKYISLIKKKPQVTKERNFRVILKMVTIY